MNLSKNSSATADVLKSQEIRFNEIKKKLQKNDQFVFIGTLLQRTAQLFPDKIALYCKQEAITFWQLYKNAWAMTQTLQQMNVKPRDKVCLLLENSILYYQAYYGIWQAGAVVAPLNIFLSEKELMHIIDDCKPSLLIISAELARKFPAMLYEKVSVLTVDPNAPITHALEQVTGKEEIPLLDQDELAALLYTSGTTGFPKGVMLSTKNIATNIAQVLACVEVSHHDRLLGILPLFHSFAQNMSLWTAVFLGASVIIAPKVERTWIVQGFKQQPTIVIAVPALYGLMCMLRDLKMDSVRYFVSGGDALSNKIRMFFELIYRRKLGNGYGLTETSPFIAVDLEDSLKDTNTIGRYAPGLQCSLRDEQGTEVPCGHVGILWVKGDNVMLGYYNAPEATKDVLTDGWFNTGDFARFDKEGRLVIVGRFKDLIIHKGFNIYPQEIENVLMNFPGTLRAAVVGIPDEQVGEIIVACVQLKEPVADIVQKLQKLCQEHLATYKIPKHFITFETLPLTALAKVDKKQLRKEAAQIIEKNK